MADDSAYSKYATWPTYPGFGEWQLTAYENSQDIPGSGDHRIREKQLPTGQFAVRNNIIASEVPIGTWSDVVIPLPAALLSNFVYTGFLTSTASYKNWLQYGKPGRTISSGASGVVEYGLMPPMFDYTVSDIYKEVVLYGTQGVASTIIYPRGTVDVIAVEGWWSWLEQRTECKMKTGQINHGQITGVSSAEEVDSSTYRYVFSVSPILSVTIDSLSGLEMTVVRLRKTDTGSYLPYTSTVTLTVEKIENGQFVALGPHVTNFWGSDAWFSATTSDATPSDLLTAWQGAYFTLNQTLVIEDPLTLYALRKRSDGVPVNDYVVETPLGFETWENRITDSGGINGVYFPRNSMIPLLEDAIAKAQAEVDAAYVPVIESEYVELFEGLLKTFQETEPVLEGMIYFPLKETTSVASYNSTGTSEYSVVEQLLPMLQTISPTSLTLYVDIGGGGTMRHNMSAGNLTGEYVMVNGTSDVFLIANHLRNNVFTFMSNSLTTSDIPEDSSTGDMLWSDADFVSLYNLINDSTTMSVNASRFWYINDICNGDQTGGGNCTMAVFWSKILTTPIEDADGNVTLDISLSEEAFYHFSQTEFLVDRFLKEAEITGSLVKGWTKYSGWHFQDLSVSVSREIVDIDHSTVNITGQMTLTLKGDSVERLTAGSEGWWISFQPLFPFAVRTGYVTLPFLALDAEVLDTGDTGRVETLGFNGIYVGPPLQINLPQSTVISVRENGVAYPNTNLPPIVYISTARRDLLAYADDRYTDSEAVLYNKNTDPSRTLYIRHGRIMFQYALREYFIYYGDEKIVSVLTTGGGIAQQMIDLGADAQEYNSTGFNAKCVGALADGDAGENARQMVWEPYHSDLLLGFDITSGKRWTEYSRLVGTEIEIGQDAVPQYIYAQSVDTKEVEYVLPINTARSDSRLYNIKLLRLVPTAYSGGPGTLYDVSARFVHRTNTLRNATDPFLFRSRGKFYHIFYTRPQGFLDENEGSVPDETVPLILPETYDELEGENPFSIDDSQDGLYLATSDDEFRTFNGGVFERARDFTPYTGSISELTTLTEDQAYLVPHLLIPNITRCACWMCDDQLKVAGYSKVGTNGVLSLVHHSFTLNLLYNQPLYMLKKDGKVMATTSELRIDPTYVAVTAEIPDIKHQILVPDLEEGAIALAVLDSMQLIIVQDNTTLRFYLSTNNGEEWTYYDDISLATFPNAVLSSPAAYVDGKEFLLLFFFVDRNSLYFKKIPLPAIFSADRELSGGRTSEKEDEGSVSVKNSLQSLLDQFTPRFVAFATDQRVGFRMDTRGTMRVVYINDDGNISAVSTTNEGDSWEQQPFNF